MQNSILRWTTRLRGGLLALLILLASAGALYQWRATAWDRQEHPPPDELVDIGDHRLHLYCTGTKRPAVILESGAINTYLTWARVQPEVARFTRVCSYDRAGHGWSSPIDEPQRSTDVAADLRQLLREAGVDPPYVLAGHSRGGLHVRTFRARYPETVAGLVLIDSAHEQFYPRVPPAYHEALDEQGSIFAVARWLAPIGVVRLLGLPEQPAIIVRAIRHVWEQTTSDTASATASNRP